MAYRNTTRAHGGSLPTPCWYSPPGEDIKWFRQLCVDRAAKIKSTAVKEQQTVWSTVVISSPGCLLGHWNSLNLEKHLKGEQSWSFRFPLLVLQLLSGCPRSVLTFWNHYSQEPNFTASDNPDSFSLNSHIWPLLTHTTFSDWELDSSACS